jgi:hypothetical protein
MLLGTVSGQQPQREASPAVRSIMERAHTLALASAQVLATAKYHQHRISTDLDEHGQAIGSPREKSMNGNDGLDFSVSTIFDPNRYDYTLDAPETFRGQPVAVLSFHLLADSSLMLPSIHHDISNGVMNSVFNHLRGKVFVDSASGAIVHFEAHLADPSLGFALGRVFQADVSCDQTQVGSSWFPGEVITTFHYQMRNWHFLFLRTSVVHQHVVATFGY